MLRMNGAAATAATAARLNVWSGCSIIAERQGQSTRYAQYVSSCLHSFYGLPELHFVSLISSAGTWPGWDSGSGCPSPVVWQCCTLSPLMPSAGIWPGRDAGSGCPSVTEPLLFSGYGTCSCGRCVAMAIARDGRGSRQCWCLLVAAGWGLQAELLTLSGLGEGYLSSSTSLKE